MPRCRQAIRNYVSRCWLRPRWPIMLFAKSYYIVTMILSQRDTYHPCMYNSRDTVVTLSDPWNMKQANVRLHYILLVTTALSCYNSFTHVSWYRKIYHVHVQYNIWPQWYSDLSVVLFNCCVIWCNTVHSRYLAVTVLQILKKAPPFFASVGYIYRVFCEFVFPTIISLIPVILCTVSCYIRPWYFEWLQEHSKTQCIPLFHDRRLNNANGSYFRFDYDNKIRYMHSHNHHEVNS